MHQTGSMLDHSQRMHPDIHIMSEKQTGHFTDCLIVSRFHSFTILGFDKHGPVQRSHLDCFRVDLVSIIYKRLIW